jgi:hypothetical protein
VWLGDAVTGAPPLREQSRPAGLWFFSG